METKQTQINDALTMGSFVTKDREYSINELESKTGFNTTYLQELINILHTAKKIDYRLSNGVYVYRFFNNVSYEVLN